MKWFINMKIGAKLIISFVLIAIIAGIIGVSGMINISNINNTNKEMFTNNTESIAYIGKWLDSYNTSRVVLRDILVSDDLSYQEQRKERNASLLQDISQYFTAIESRIISEEERQRYNDLYNTYQAYLPLMNQAIEQAMAGRKDGATEVIQNNVQLDIIKFARALLDYNIEQAGLKQQSNNAVAANAILIMLTLAAAGMIVAIVLGLYISRIISRPIHALVLASQQMADGDMNVTLRVDSRDEIGTLSQAFSTMAESMNEVLHNINTAADQVASGSRQVSEASQALSQGSTEQASSTEQLSASIVQIAEQTKLNARGADEANRFAIEASGDAEKGNAQMKDMLNAMEEINEASGNISKIIKVIDEIAFQTNILALNAAVEAARAGQHGKGFAVVAEEVRNLAARSANAAKETTVLIEGSIKKAEAGTRIASETAAALNKIVEGVNQAASIVGTIASASNEQSIAISQVNQGISQVSAVVQSNSATSEQCAAASEELSGQSEQLKEMVARFKLKNLGSAHLRYNPYAADLSSTHRGSYSSTLAQSDTAASGKIKIQLDEDDFGKYE